MQKGRVTLLRDYNKLDSKLSAGDIQPTQDNIVNLVNCYNESNFSAAVEAAQKFIKTFPRHPIGHKVLGASLVKVDRTIEAIPHLQKCVSLDENDAEAHCNLGAIYSDIGKYAEAEFHCRCAIKINPLYSRAFNNLGTALQHLGRLAEAEESFRLALHISPDFSAAHCNFGALLARRNNFIAAEESFRNAILHNKKFSEAYCSLGAVQMELNKLYEAKRNLLISISLKPNFPEAYNNLGITLKRLGEIKEAAQAYKTAITLNPLFLKAFSNLLLTMNYLSDMPVQEHFKLSCEFGNTASRLSKFKFICWPNLTKRPSKLRIGFVSADLRNHPVGYFTQALLSKIDKTKFELYAFNNNPLDDDLSIQLKKDFSRWFNIRHLSDLESALLIYENKINILIDLSGHTAGNRLGVFPYKPAPVQATWLGYFSSTGVREIDYIIGDSIVTPISDQNYFTEKIWQLPDTYLCFTPPPYDLQVNDLPALNNGYITFGCFSNLTKVNDSVISTWSRILNLVPTSKIMIKTSQLDDHKVRRNLIEKFSSFGIHKSRLILEGQSSRLDYFKSYYKIDMVLDTFPFPGGTTSVESMWMGAPVLTIRGQRFISRNGETIAINSGQSHWIASSIEDYISKACKFSNEIDSLALLRRDLRAKIIKSPTFNADLFSHNLSNSLDKMWTVYSSSDL